MKNKDIYKEGLEPHGRFYGNYYGIVESLEDPENLGRVLARVPEVKGPLAGPIWAFAKGQYSGEGYGTQLLPEKGEHVIITFRQGHPGAPMWEHAHYSRGQKPEDFNPHHIKGIITSGGVKILIDDQEEIVKVELPSGTLIRLEGDSIFFDTNKVFINTEDEGEPLLKGTETESLLKDILNLIGGLCEAIGTDVSTTGAITGIAPTLVSKATSTILEIQAKLLGVSKIKSTRNFGT